VRRSKQPAAYARKVLLNRHGPQREHQSGDDGRHLQRADRVLIVDGGGDILATGHEAGLRSPLEDSLVLAAADGLDRDVQVLVAGLGLDGELSEDVLLQRCARLGGTLAGRPSAEDARGYQQLFGWHPSEATGLFCAAALGARGWVEVRGAGLAVRLTDHSSEVYRLQQRAVMSANQVAQAVVGTRSLARLRRPRPPPRVSPRSRRNAARLLAWSVVRGATCQIFRRPWSASTAMQPERPTEESTTSPCAGSGKSSALPLTDCPSSGDRLRQGRSLPYFPPLWPVGEEQRPGAGEVPSGFVSRRVMGSE
jgi:Protein of unknown function (DUF1152)